MADVVFILGAGASRQGGAPLMSDFLDVADNLWRTNQVREKADFFKSVFEAIGRMQAVHSKAQLDLKNIESVFNAFVMARILNKFPGDTDFSGEAVEDALKQLIAATLQKTLLFPVQHGNIIAPKPYPGFASLLDYLRREAHPQRSVAVLTFNYDLGADYALYANRLGPDYCLDGAVSEGVPLLKLHGSMNWGVCSKCSEVVPWGLNAFFKTFSYRHLSDSETAQLDVWSQFEHLTHCDAKVAPLPFLVPPTWNKSDQQETIRVVWQRAAKELTDAEHIFIIGYSLPETDAFFRTLYALGVVGGMPLKRIWVYNPDRSDNVEKRFRQLIGPGAEARFRYIATPFNDAISDIKREFPARR
ncbi:MAG: hypothetical protein A3G24_13120 [Betaproteobacteria bacterium RIFCSPLOWO2_12_FULL_62_13]|nr:MAG: hypothetical protein A3G24_13120 [Betaproteobacteria bacterium RIFCSPLOWO2_12_FULL_62_13]